MDFSRCCAIVGSAAFDAKHFLAERDAGRFACVLAADGGFAHLESIGVAPDVALGDFDSLGYIPEAPCVVRHPVMKDATDLELAFDWLWCNGYTSAVVYGALGGRLDQTMATQQTLIHFARCGMNVAAVGEGYLIIALSSHGRRQASMLQQSESDADISEILESPDELAVKCDFLSANHRAIEACSYSASLTISAGIEGIISLCAMGGDAKGVTEQGLLYEIENATLPCDSALGVSNEFTGRAAYIEVADGDVLVFMPAVALSLLA